MVQDVQGEGLGELGTQDGHNNTVGGVSSLQVTMPKAFTAQSIPKEDLLPMRDTHCYWNKTVLLNKTALIIPFITCLKPWMLTKLPEVPNF